MQHMKKDRYSLSLERYIRNERRKEQILEWAHIIVTALIAVPVLWIFVVAFAGWN